MNTDNNLNEDSVQCQNDEISTSIHNFINDNHTESVMKKSPVVTAKTEPIDKSNDQLENDLRNDLYTMPCNSQNDLINFSQASENKQQETIEYSSELKFNFEKENAECENALANKDGCLNDKVNFENQDGQAKEASAFGNWNDLSNDKHTSSYHNIVSIDEDIPLNQGDCFTDKDAPSNQDSRSKDESTFRNLYENALRHRDEKDEVNLRNPDGNDESNKEKSLSELDEPAAVDKCFRPRQKDVSGNRDGDNDHRKAADECFLDGLLHVSSQDKFIDNFTPQFKRTNYRKAVLGTCFESEFQQDSKQSQTKLVYDVQNNTNSINDDIKNNNLKVDFTNEITNSDKNTKEMCVLIEDKKLVSDIDADNDIKISNIIRLKARKAEIPCYKMHYMVANIVAFSFLQCLISLPFTNFVFQIIAAVINILLICDFE